MIEIRDAEKSASKRDEFWVHYFVGLGFDVEPGKSIRIFGTDTNRIGGDLKFNRTFKIGDTVKTKAYNFVYTGNITAIGPKTITAKDDCDGSVIRMSFAKFAYKNCALDLAKIQAQNDKTMMEV